MTDRFLRLPTDFALATRWLLALTIFMSVGLFDLGAQKPFDVVKIVAIWFFVWLAAGFWMAGMVRGRDRPGRFMMGYLALAFLGASLLSALLSKTPWTALLGWYGRYTGVATLLIFVLAFFIVASIYRDRPNRTHELIWAVAAGAWVLMAYVLIQWLKIDPVHWATTAGKVPGQRYFGTMGNADFAGGYIGLSFPCVFYAYGRANTSTKRVLVLAWGVIQLGTLWITAARNGMAALLLGLLALLFIYRRSVPRWLRIAALAATAAVIVLALALVVSAGKTSIRKLSQEGVLRTQTVKVRGYWWLAGLRMFAHHPVLGTGPDTYVSEYQRYLSPKAAQVADSEIADKPHNVFVDRLATGGILGFGAFAALLAVAFWRGYLRLRDGPPQRRRVEATFLAFLAAYVGQAFFSIDMPAIAIVAWVSLGAIAAVADPVRATEKRAARSRGFVIVSTAVALVLACLLAALGADPLRADHEAHTASRLGRNADDSGEVMKHYNRAMTFHPLEPLYPGAAGDYLDHAADRSTDEQEKLDLLTQAVALYRKTLSLQPRYHLWMLVLGRGIGHLATTGEASFTDAQPWFARARERAPYDWRVPSWYGDMLYQWAKKERSAALICRAQRQYKRAVFLRRNQPSPLIGLGRTYLALGHPDDALKRFRRATKLDPSNETAQSLFKTTQELIDKNTKLTVLSC